MGVVIGEVHFSEAIDGTVGEVLFQLTQDKPFGMPYVVGLRTRNYARGLGDLSRQSGWVGYRYAKGYSRYIEFRLSAASRDWLMRWNGCQDTAVVRDPKGRWVYAGSSHGLPSQPYIALKLLHHWVLYVESGDWVADSAFSELGYAFQRREKQ